MTGLADLPEHAMWLGHICCVSGHLEGLLGHLVAYLSDASAPVAISMFHAVISAEGQKAMLNAAAEHKLVGAELAEFRDLMDEFKTRYGERNRLIHNQWGTSPQHPDKAVWMHSKDSARVSGALASAASQEQLDLYIPEARALWQKCSLYTKKDLQNVFDRLSAYTNRVREFVLKLQNEHPVLGHRPGQPEPEPIAEQGDDTDQASAPADDRH